ncbi:CBS domain-containing protein [Melittangium boletus]|nr:CBS domain-containing protein [Melittangium boletus]
MKTIRDVMTRDVEGIDAHAPLVRAAEAMRRLGVRELPVCDGGRVVGLVTDRDLVVRGVAMGHDPRTSRLSSVMTEDVEWLRPDTRLDEAAKRLRNGAARHLVVDEEGTLLGSVSWKELEAGRDEHGNASGFLPAMLPIK